MEFAMKEGLEAMQTAATVGKTFAKELPIALGSQKRDTRAPAGGQGEKGQSSLRP